MSLLLPDYPDIPETTASPSRPSRVDLTATARAREKRMRLSPGDGWYPPTGYGRDFCNPALPKVGVYNGSLVMLLVWGIGPFDGLEYFRLSDGSAVPAAITVTHYNGTAGQAVDPTLAAAFPGWANNLEAVVGGQTLALAYSVALVPPGAVDGVPEFLAQWRLRKVYDPRDVGQSLADPSTWLWSENPALAKADFEASPVYGRGRSIDWDSVATCADACDEEIQAGEPRRKIGLVLERRATVDQWSQTLAGYAGCITVDTGEEIRLVPDRPRAASRSIDDSQILLDAKGGPDLTLSKISNADAPNRVRVVYTRASDDGSGWYDAHAVASLPGVSDGSLEIRESRIPLPGVHRYSQAYREAVERLNAANLADLRMKCKVTDQGLADLVGDVIEVTSARGLTNKDFTLTGARPIAPGRWELSGPEYQANVYSDAIENAPAAPDTDLPNPLELPALTGLAISEEVYQLRDGTWASRLRITWDPPGAAYPYPHEYEIQILDGPTLVWLITAKEAETVTPAVQEGIYYTVQVRARTEFGAAGAWLVGYKTPAGKYLIPGDVPSLTGFEVGGEVRLSWEPAIDVDIWRYEVRYGATSVTWANATLLDRVDALRLVTKEVPAGTWDFLVRALDSVGQYSANDARKQITVTVDTDAFLVGTTEFDTPTLSNMVEYRLTRIDPVAYYVTDMGEAADTIFTTTPLDTTYPNTAATYHAAQPCEWLSETWDLGQTISGNWVAEIDTTAISGSYTETLELSTDAASWDGYTSLNAKTGARYARVRIATASTDTLLVTVPSVLIRLDAVAREEIQMVTTAASGPTTVELENVYSAVKEIILTPEATAARSAVYDNIQIGPRATNLLTQTEAFDHADWTKINGLSVTSNATTAPDGSTTADKITGDGTASPRIQQTKSYSGVSDQIFTFSIWAWTDSGQPVDASLLLIAGSFEWTAAKGITLTTTPKRFSFTATVGSSISTQQIIARFDPDSALAAGEYFYLWGAHLDDNDALTPYVAGPASFDGINKFDCYEFDASGTQVAGSLRTKFRGI